MSVGRLPYRWKWRLNWRKWGVARFPGGHTDVELDKELLGKLVAIQKLPEEDKKCIMYAVDGLIQHAKTRQAYKK